MKEQILKLRSEGKTYSQIKKIVGCSKGTISYHCGEGQKEKTKIRQRKIRNNNPLRKKIEKFKNRMLKIKVGDFQRNRNKSGVFGKGREYNFTEEDLLIKIGPSPKCYLTGRSIDLHDTKNYQLDHIIPTSKEGENTLSNLGLTCKEANKAKDNLSIECFIKLCKEVLEYNNYNITRK